jgi:hypothetical protein
MVWAPSHDLSAGVVEEDHSVEARSFLAEGEEVANPQVLGNGKGSPAPDR